MVTACIDAGCIASADITIHGKLKRLIRPTLGFQSLRTALATIKGFEVMHALKKGQGAIFRCLPGVAGEVSLVNRTFGLCWPAMRRLCAPICPQSELAAEPDRLGRLATELVALIDELAGRGVAFRALNSPMDTTTPAGRAFLQIQAAFAEMERNVICQRVREGLAAARARGRIGGRPRVMTAEKLRYAQRLMADPSRSIPSICQELGGIRPSTLYHYLHADGALKKAGQGLIGEADRSPLSGPG